MNILGVGTGEIIVILIIMLVVAGPKRMIAWSYQLGRYVTQLRAMFEETMNAFQKEMADSGINVPKDLKNVPLGGFDIIKEATKVISTDVTANTDAISQSLGAAMFTNNAAPETPPTPPPSSASQPSAPPAAPSVPPEAPNGAASSNDNQPAQGRYDSWTPS